MSSENLARRALVDVSFAGVDISKSLRPYLLSMTYTDNEEDEADDLQLRLHDRESIWLESWLQDMLAGGGFLIRAAISRENWTGGGIDCRLDCGSFELDSAELSGPPSVVAVKATALPFSNSIRQTKKTKAWESYSLSGISNQVAAENGMSCLYLAAYNPSYARVEQYRQSDIAFLSRLCKDAGLSLKATDNQVVIFDQGRFEKRDPVRTIRRKRDYISYRLSVQTADDQYTSCRVSYTDPGTGRCVEGTARVDEYNEAAKNNQQLEVKAKVKSSGEAKTLAEKRLRLHNKFSKTLKFTLPGDPVLLAGNAVQLAGWGAFDGRYLIQQAVHKVDAGGYTTAVQLRRAIEGY